jgi:hypothetical protein
VCGHALPDGRQGRIEDASPGRAGHVGVTATDERPFVEALPHATAAEPAGATRRREDVDAQFGR